MNQKLLAAAAVTTSVLLAPAARADLPPPDGTKFVGYTFKLENQDAFKDYVLLAWRCDLKQTDGPLVAIAAGAASQVGRHGGACEVYGTKKSDYEAWQKGVKLNGQWTDPALDDYLKSAKVHKCSGGPKVVFTLPTSDSRTLVADSLKIESLDEKACSFASTSAPAPSSSPTAPPVATTGQLPDPAPSATPASSASTPPPAARGCGGCSVAPDSNQTTAGLIALGIGLVAFGSRRPRNR